ncbi:Casanova [Gamsiella multidivaricata]|nr:Casanova [Gamsiella multidivaricata]
MPSISSSSKPRVTSSSKTSNPSQAKKAPRPSNSFLIYRKEHAKAYAGLVATELSTKLAKAWKNETPERRAYYAMLAERAKAEHAIKYPNYKFTPIKRGTGKRALALAAMANAAKKIADDSVIESDSSSSSTRSSPTSKSITKYSDASSSGGTCSAHPLAHRPRRNTQKPHRFSSSPYPHIPTACVIPNHGSYSLSPSADSTDAGCLSSLPFYSMPIDQWNNSSPGQFSTIIGSPAFSTISSSSGVSTDMNDFEYKLKYEDSESEDIDAEGEYEDDDSTGQISKAFGQLLSHENSLGDIEVPSQGVSSLPSPPYLEEPSIFGVSTFPSLLSMEAFEPECLARDGAQWTTATTNALCPIMSAPTMSTCSTSSCSSSSSSYGYSTPSYEDCRSTPAQFSLDMASSTSSCLNSSQSSGILPLSPSSSPVRSPLYSPAQVIPVSQQLSASQIPPFPFELPPLVVRDEMLMSPALSGCSALSPHLTRTFPEAQLYFASAIEWM